MWSPPPPHRRRFPLPGMLEMTHLWLLCISLHRSLIHANVGDSSSWQPTRATSPGVINYSCTVLAPWQDGEIFPLFLIFKSSYIFFLLSFPFLETQKPLAFALHLQSQNCTNNFQAFNNSHLLLMLAAKCQTFVSLRLILQLATWAHLPSLANVCKGQLACCNSLAPAKDWARLRQQGQINKVIITLNSV